jgi:hypothetical protein
VLLFLEAEKPGVEVCSADEENKTKQNLKNLLKIVVC